MLWKPLLCLQLPARCQLRATAGAGVEVQWLATVVDSAATRRDGCTDKSSAPATHCSVQQAGYLAVAEILLAGCPEGGRAVCGLALLPLLQEAITSPICLPAGAGGCLGLAALWPRSAGRAHQPASAMRPGPACQRLLLLRQPPTKGCAVHTLALRRIAADVESTRSMAGLRWLLGRMPPDHLFDMSVGLLTPTQAALQARGCRSDLAFPCGHSLPACLLLWLLTPLPSALRAVRPHHKQRHATLASQAHLPLCPKLQVCASRVAFGSQEPGWEGPDHLQPAVDSTRQGQAASRHMRRHA